MDTNRPDRLAEIEEILARMAARNDRLAAENDRYIAESRAAREVSRKEIEAFRKGMEEFKEEMKEFRNTVGNFGRRLGEIVEIVVIPGIRPVLKKHGHEYERVCSNKIIKDHDDCKVAEVDVLLDNGTEAMAVEIKTSLSTGMVDRHINRLKDIRANEEAAGIQGKILYGAVAAIMIEPHVQRYALNKGLYFIEIIEDEDRLEIVAPKIVGKF